ncbi:MAG: BatA domain-containing protein [Pirellulaceae bacterium]
MFLHTWAVLVGLGAIGLPLAVHFLTKPRPVSLPLSTLRFVREAVRMRRARHRLRDILVLTLRTLAILLIALAVARPQPSRKPLINDSQAGAAVRVVVLDVSQSMAALHRGTASLERARTVAASFLRYRPGLSANLIIAGARPYAVLTEPSQNFEALRDALARCQVRPERLDVNRAMALAAEMLAPGGEAEPRRRELIVVSDFQRSNWARADLAGLPQSTQIQLESTATEELRPNLALLRAEFRGRTSVGSSARLELEIGNYSTTARSVTVEISLGDATARVVGTCPADRRTTLVQEIPMHKAGWQVGEVRLSGISDVLAADDQRGIAAQVGQQSLYALITRQPAAERPSSSHFLECGLVPDLGSGATASARLVRLIPGRLDRPTLASADLIVVDHPGKLSPEDVQLLSGLLRRGHPVLYVAAEGTDAMNLRLLSESAGAELQMPVEFAPPPAGQLRRDLFLTAVRGEAAPFAVFGDNTAAIIGSLRFAGGLSSRRRENALEEDLLATYNDGSACLVQTSSGAGTLAVLNADLGSSNLPRLPAFVLLLDQLVQRLLERGGNLQESLCGEPLVCRLAGGEEDAGKLHVVGPPGSDGTSLGELSHDGSGVVWNWQAPASPGVYRILRGEETLLAVPITVSSDESQLESLSADVLENRLAAGHAVQLRQAGEGLDQRDVLWTWLLTAGVLCLLGELAILLTLRS